MSGSYSFCAKGGHKKETNAAYVCHEHWRTPGWFTHCARCGGLQPLQENQTTRCYVHHHCLVRKP